MTVFLAWFGLVCLFWFVCFVCCCVVTVFLVSFGLVCLFWFVGWLVFLCCDCFLGLVWSGLFALVCWLVWLGVD